jgi:hypothetical protein
LGANYLNDWFLDPPGLLDELVRSGLIIPGDPEHSPFFDRTTYTGPMYKVFDADELALWQEWTRSLAQPPAPSPLTPLAAMVRVVDTLRDRQVGQLGHLLHLLKGCDPHRPARLVEGTIAWWFTQPSTAFVAAIAHPVNALVVPGRPEDSVFVNDLIAPDNAMGAAFSDTIPGTGDRTGRQIAIAWIEAGCPTVPVEAMTARTLLFSAAPAAERAPAPAEVRPRVLGMGAVH